MKIVADENIPYAESAFATLGEVCLIAGRDITSKTLGGADAAIIRSVTKVNAELLDGTDVRFVGTATIGIDHVDTAYLEAKGVGFSNAPGSNANSVAEWVVAALLVLSLRRGEPLTGRTLGVVGCGNVGSRVAAKAEALGMTVLRNDPPLQRRTGDPIYLRLDDLLETNFLTLHVPLTREGQDATFHMVDTAFLRRMRPEATLINSSRGAVVDGAALGTALAAGALRDAVLDVWEGEPRIDFGLVAKVALGAPHIAGYSFDGKFNGTAMVYEAACRLFGLDPTWSIEDVAAPTPLPRLELRAAGREDEAMLHEAVKALYDIEADDENLRASGPLPDDARAARFDELRKTYPKRREFHNTTIECPDASAALLAKLKGIGFRVD